MYMLYTKHASMVFFSFLDKIATTLQVPTHTSILQLHSTAIFMVDFVLQKCIVLLQLHDFIHIKQGGGMLRRPFQNRLELVKPTSVGNRPLFVQTCRH